ncbi:MAG TPA: serine hydrolase, partial [Rhodothermales bacterium]|nr:serine hydrolase [Rhodothermales bacterium]
VPVAPDMVFGIGSGTKTYTAALLLLLAEEGRVDLDAGVGTYLPWLTDYPNITVTASLRRLLSHRSGIANYTSNPAFGAALFADPAHLFTPDEILSFVGTPLFNPGSGWNYSNTNYYLAGLVIEAVTGMSAPEAFAAYFTGPQGLAHTRFGWEPVPEGQQWAHGWATVSGGGSIDLTTLSPNSNFSAAFTAGGLVSTAEESARWARALWGGDVLSAASFAQMTTLTALGSNFPGGRTVGYGLGVFALELGGVPVWAHSGRIAGYSGSMAYDPARDVSIAVLANRNGSGNPDAMLAELHAVVAQHVVAAEGGPAGGDALDLQVVGPNPSRGPVFFRFTTATAGPVRLEVLDVLGRRVAVPAEGAFSPGRHEVRWGASATANGVYVVRLRQGGHERVRPLTVAH